MGTTLTALLFAGSKVGLVHIGDSRAYLVRDGEFAQITQDDTYVQMLVDEGRITWRRRAPTRSGRCSCTRSTAPRSSRSCRSGRPRRRPVPDLQRRAVRRGLAGHAARPCSCRPAPVRRPAGRARAARRRPGQHHLIVADVIDGPYVEEAPVVGGAAAATAAPGAATDTTPAARAATLQPAPGARATPRRSRRPGRAGAGSGSRSAWSRCSSSSLRAATACGGGPSRSTTSARRRRPGRGLPRRPRLDRRLHLSSVVNTDPLRLDDLLQVPRRQVQDGIPAEQPDDAEQIIARLLGQQKPLCPTPTPTPTPDPAPRPGRGPRRPRRRTTTAPTPSTPTSPADPSGTEPPGDEGCRAP